MNKSYKSVWNESRGTWVATSELTTSRGKRSKATAIASVAAALFVVGQGLVGSAQAETAHYAAGEGAVAGVEKLWVHPCQVGECANPWEFANPNYPAPPNVSSTAVGSSAAAQLGGVALGDHAAAEAGFGVALGAYSLASGSFATAVGTSAVASGRDTTAVGLNALASADRSIVLGSWGVASGVDSMALGHKTTATGTDSVALGGEATSSGPEAIAAGYQAASTADLATSLGSRATSSAYGATALGASAAANGGAATAVGVYAEASGVASVALGAGAVATSDNSVALGANSRTASAVGTAGTTIRGTEYTFAGANPTSTVSVGSVGNERTITNVAAGRLSATSTDAVNGSQLYATNQAIEQISQASNAGWNVSAQGQNATNVAPGGTVDLKNTDGNLAVSKSTTGNDVNFDLARDLKVDSVTMGDTVVNNDGLTIKNGPSITTGGIDAGGSKIINVAAGVDAGDAVNKEQLDEVGKTASAGWNVSAQGQNATNVAPGGTVDLKNTDGNLAVSKSATGNDVNFDLARDLKVDSVTMGDTVVNNDGLTIKNGPSITTGGIDGGGRKIINVAAGVDAGDAVNKEQLDEVGKTASAGWNVSAQGANATNVAPGGTVDLKNTDGNLAVSKSTTGNDVNFDLARDLKVDSVTMGDTVVNNDGLTIKNGPSITTGGIDAGGSKIINVAAGVDAGDAVNKEQLDEVGKTASAGWNVSAQGQNATNVAPGGTVDLKNTDGNLAVSKSATGNDVNFDLARDLKVDSVTMGDTVVNNDGLTIKNGPSITTGGIDAGGRKIINVAAGVDAGDAVNKEQLDEVGKTASAGWNVSAQGQNATNVAPGGTVDLKNTDGNLAVSKSATGNDVNFDLARDLKVDSVTMGDTVVNNDGLTIKNGPSITTGGIDAGGRKIINVAAGVDAGDAVNKEQLDEVGKTASAGWNVSAQGANATNVAPGGTVDLKNTDGNLAVSKSATGSDVNFDLARDLKVDSVTMGDTVVNNDGLTIKNGPSITTGGIDAGGRTITNVAEGVNPGDAVNMAQLTETNTNVTNLGDQVTTIGDQVTSIGEQVTNVYENGTKYFHANSTGADSSALGEDSVAIGMGAVSNNANDVALGAGSTTAAAVGTAGATIGGTAYAFAGANPTSTVSVGSVGNERTITNVAAGRLSATSTDAVNGSQLYATNQQVDQLSEDIRNGAGSGTDPLAVHYDDSSKGAITLGDGINGTKVTNVAEGELSSTSRDAVNGSQLYATNQQVDQNTKSITNLGDQVTNVYEKGTKYFHANSTGADSLALGEDSVAIGMGAVSNNANDVALGAGSTTSATVGTSGATIGGTEYAFAGANPTSTVSVGSDGNERTITNVAAGRLSATSTDAVNGSQLYATNQALDQIGSNITNLDHGAVKYDIDIDGTVNYNSVTLGGGRSSGPVVLTNVAAGSSTYDAVNYGQLQALQNEVTNVNTRVTNLENNGGSGGNGGSGSNPYFNATDTSSDDSAVVNVAAPGTGAGSTTAGSGAVATGDNGTAVGSNANASDSAVAIGSGAAASSGAVAVGQGAQATASSSVALGQDSVADRENTVSVGSAGRQRQVTNVAAGSQATDAVNVSQLTTVVDGLGGGASIDPTTGAVTGPSYQLSGGTYSNVGDALSGLDDRMNAADQAINDVARGAYSGIAAATALTMIPDVDKDKTLSIGIGGGTYKGYQAVAIGGTARITQNIKMKAGVGLSSGGTTVGVGASYQW
ncbi:autotransporter adhesin [Paraburkholderia atlantica]